MNRKTAIISQARMTSTRLPGKVLKKVGGKTLLEYHIDRLQWSGIPVIIATTTNREDDPIVEMAGRYNIEVFRGDEQDVLSRYYHTANKYHLDTIIRVTSDCPLIDGNLIRAGLDAFQNCDYLSVGLKRTYPRGMDFEIFTRSALDQAQENASAKPEREHVTPYIHRTNSYRFRLKQFTDTEDNSDIRITVDTPEDFQLIEELISTYACHEKNVHEIIDVFKEHPSLREFNTNIRQKRYGE